MLFSSGLFLIETEEQHYKVPLGEVLPQMLFIWKCRVWTNRWQWQELQSHNHRVIRVRMSPVQALAQNRWNPEVSLWLRSAVFFPVGPWKSPRESTDSPGNLFHLFNSSCCAYIQFLLYAVCSSVCLLPTFSHHSPLWRAWFLLAQYFSMPSRCLWKMSLPFSTLIDTLGLLPSASWIKV